VAAEAQYVDLADRVSELDDRAYCRGARVCLWPFCDIRRSGKHILGLSFTGFDTSRRRSRTSEFPLTVAIRQQPGGSIPC
jgi:hypothetical protein